MTHKYLYDNEEQFYPISEASAIMGGVVTQGNTVWQDLEQIYSKVQSAINDFTGATQVQGQLGVTVEYTNTSSNKSDDIQNVNAWNPTMTIPDSLTPYTWKKTTYYWSDTVIKTTYEICATALYPETQIMYTAILSIKDGLQGPVDYGEEVEDGSHSMDINNEKIKWYNYFPGLDATKIYGYMATRHRDAGKAWPDGGGWHISLFAQYPIASTPTTE